MPYHFKKIFFIYFILVTIQSCTVTKKAPSALTYENSSCYHQSDYAYTADNLPRPIHTLHLDTALTSNYSATSLNIANALGLLDDLNKYALLSDEFKINPSTDLKIEILEIIQSVNHTINTSSLEISSVTSELDCEEERASQISGFLKGKSDTREKKLVIGSIVTGAAGSVAAELLSGNASTYVAIGTSLAEASLGLLMLFNNPKTFFYHFRNTPAEIWYGPVVSKTLPPSIWYYLNYKNTSGSERTLREQLIHNWTAFGQIDTVEKDDRNIPIYFGTGGKYSAEQLQNRADMYDQIEAYISLMKQELSRLSNEFGSNVKRNNTPALKRG